MEVIDNALTTDAPLSIRVVSELGKSSLQLYFSRKLGDLVLDHTHLLWNKLILTALSSQVTDKHLTAACNALCVFLTCASSSKNVQVEQFALSRSVWFDALSSAHRAFNSGKSKPALQVLETLCQMIRRQPEKEVADGVLREATLPLLRIVLLGTPRAELKKACIMLSCLLQRTPLFDQLVSLATDSLTDVRLGWEDRLSRHNIRAADIQASTDHALAPLLLSLICAMVELDTRSAALKLSSALNTVHPDSSTSTDLNILAGRMIELFLEKNDMVVGDFTDHVLPAILDDAAKFGAWVKHCGLRSRKDPARLTIFLSVLRAGRVKKFVSEDGETGITLLDKSPNLCPAADLPAMVNDFLAAERDGGGSPEDTYISFRILLRLASSGVRIHAYNLLTTSPAANAIVPTGTLRCLRSCIKYIHEDADAHERGEILSITRRLLRRIHASTVWMRKLVVSGKAANHTNAVFEEYEHFLACFHEFLRLELAPGISYQRHILSLQTWQLYFAFIDKPHIQQDSLLVRALVNLVLDPYEDVRSTAAALLTQLASTNPTPVAAVIHRPWLDEVQLLAASTGRADHADGMGRGWALMDRMTRDTRYGGPQQDETCHTTSALAQLIERLEDSTASLETFRPSSTFPLHGALLALAYCLQGMQVTDDWPTKPEAQRILGICSNVWDCVVPQLCVDSPETAAEDEDDDVVNGGPKDLLAYSWRALRDSSLVMQAVLGKCSGVVNLYSVIGDLCVEQLIMLRHRGAFSTVAQTFTSCCECVRRSNDEGVHALLDRWLQAAFDQIEKQASRLTRRSAGLPAMLCAILSPDDIKRFPLAISMLMQRASQGVQAERAEGQAQDEQKLPQVHALNCLKAIMTNSRFSAGSHQYLGSMLELAASSLSSDVWAIRNCGLMLFQACINRLDTRTNGPFSENGNIGKQDEHNTPLVIAFRLLETSEQELGLLDSVQGPSNPISSATAMKSSLASENVFAALDLLGHMSAGHAAAERFNTAVYHQFSNPSWAVRDHAALLMATSIRHADGLGLIKKIIMEAESSTLTQNQVHGILLSCRYAARAAWVENLESKLGPVLEVVTALSELKTEPRSPYVTAAMLDFLNDAVVFAAKDITKSRGFESQLALAIKGVQSIHAAHRSFCLSRILLSRTYECLYAGITRAEPTGTVDVLLNDLVADHGAAEYVLQNILEHHAHLPPSSLLGLLCLILPRLDQDDLLAQAMIGISKCLEDGKVVLHPDWVRPLRDKVDFNHAGSRELRNSSLRLEAHLHAQTLGGDDDCTVPRPRLHSWLNALRLAALDEIEVPTRLNAVRALAICLPKFVQTDRYIHNQDINLRMFAILYDLLNDDDDEVRSVAVLALENSTGRGFHPIGFCPLAAREALLSVMTGSYKESRVLAMLALLKIVGAGHVTPSFWHQTEPSSEFGTTVATRLYNIQSNSNDLFAEERQNLYIDHCCEIKNWTAVLEVTGLDHVPPTTFIAATSWTLNGLDELIRLAQFGAISSLHLMTPNNTEGEPEDKSNPRTSSAVFGNPLEVTYHQDVLLVFMQVISLARVLRHAHPKAGDPRDQLGDKLLLLEKACLKNQAHEMVMQGIADALAVK